MMVVYKMWGVLHTNVVSFLLFFAFCRLARHTMITCVRSLGQSSHHPGPRPAYTTLIRPISFSFHSVQFALIRHTLNYREYFPSKIKVELTIKICGNCNCLANKICFTKQTNYWSGYLDKEGDMKIKCPTIALWW